MAIPAHRLYPILALTLLAALTLWLARVSAPEDPRERAGSREKADFIAEQARLTSFDVDGRMRYELLAERITHYPQTDITTLLQPRLEQRADGGVLYLQSAHGELRQRGDEVWLSGDVRVRRIDHDDPRPMTLVSETLTLWPDDHRAHTATPVVITRGGSVVRATGMTADNIFGTLELDGRVYATMPRQPRNPRP